MRIRLSTSSRKIAESSNRLFERLGAAFGDDDAMPWISARSVCIGQMALTLSIQRIPLIATFAPFA